MKTIASENQLSIFEVQTKGKLFYPHQSEVFKQLQSKVFSQPLPEIDDYLDIWGLINEHGWLLFKLKEVDAMTNKRWIYAEAIAHEIEYDKFNFPRLVFIKHQRSLKMFNKIFQQVRKFTDLSDYNILHLLLDFLLFSFGDSSQSKLSEYNKDIYCDIAQMLSLYQLLLYPYNYFGYFIKTKGKQYHQWLATYPVLSPYTGVIDDNGDLLLQLSNYHLSANFDDSGDNLISKINLVNSYLYAPYFLR